MTRFRRSETVTLHRSAWLTLSSHTLVDEGGQPHDHPALTVEMSDWVNVLAVTESHEIILVRQHRFGTQQDSLEIPGGMIDPGEDPLASARRELAEETGYTADRWEPFGWSHPNPALQSNRLYTFVARDARRTMETALDPLEDCRVELLPLAKLPALLASGQIRHALVLVALYQLLLAERAAPVHAL
jgi:ADP-ribose pyrophosphatase